MATADLGLMFMGIERLRAAPRDNWFAWKTRITSLLDVYGLLQHLTEDFREASGTDEDKNKAQTEWKAADDLVMAVVKLAVADADLPHVYGATTARTMWRQLCIVTEPRGTLSVVEAQQKLFRMNYAEGTSITDHLAAFQAERDNLNRMGPEYAISDQDFALLLLESLPKSWDSFTAIHLRGHAGSGFANITSSAAIGAVIGEDRLRRERAATGGQSANAVSKRTRKSRRALDCERCGRKGHTKATCWFNE